jgi:hypothetical protein
MTWNGSKADVVKTVKEAREKYGKRNIYCLIVDDEKFYAGSAKYDVDRLLSTSDDWSLGPENFEDVKAYYGFVLDVKNLPDEIKEVHMRDRDIIVIREFTYGQKIEVSEMNKIGEARGQIEKEIADDDADIDEYLILVGTSCDLALAIKEASSNVLIEREVYGD